MSKPVAGRKVGEREALAVATTVRGSAQKLNLVAGLIRGKNAGEAVTALTFSSKAMAVDVKKCLQSAIAFDEKVSAVTASPAFLPRMRPATRFSF